MFPLIDQKKKLGFGGLGVRAHESTKEDRLFGTDYKTMGYQREVVSTVHDAAIWIIYRSRLSMIMDNAQPSEIALAEQLEYSTRQGRHFRRNGSLEPNILVPQSWPEAGSTPEDWKKIWTSVHKRPTLPKHRALRWRILVERVTTNSTFPGHDPKCTRCNASRDTIRHTFFECPELTPVWQWAERCIVTITGPRNTPVLTARNLILGDLTESSRTARHVARITFDSVLWQIHRDRIAFHFESTRASPEIIINQAKLDIEEVIGAELIRVRKTRQIEQFRRRWSSQKNMKFDFSPTKSPTRINHPTRKTISKPKSSSKAKSPPKTKAKAARSPNGT
ncbi:uncharacterized protein VTP21DRAFT_10274 [Calcarisporiella thermophila]|uniref:uncharacterized protein n=1 Tax=Calcarisporiella thermophila TaxID=911321 RepID=UPI0037425C1A